MESETILQILLGIFTIVGVIVGYWFKGLQDKKEYDRRKKQDIFVEDIKAKRQILREIHPLIDQIYKKMGLLSELSGDDRIKTKEEMLRLQEKIDDAIPYFLTETEINKKLYGLRNLIFADPKVLLQSGVESPWITSKNIEEVIEKRIKEIDKFLSI